MLGEKSRVATGQMESQYHCAEGSQHRDANKILAMQILWRLYKPPLTIQNC